MPSRMIHYAISTQVLNWMDAKIKIDDNWKQQFLIGSVAPDSSSVDRVKRDVLHFFYDDKMGTRYIDIEGFKAKYNTSKTDPFVLGYLLHLICDFLWLNTVYKKYIVEIKENKDIVMTKYYNDYHSLNCILKNKFNLTYRHHHCNTVPISELEVADLNNSLKDFESDFNDEDIGLQLFNAEDILNFISLSVNYLYHWCSIDEFGKWLI